MNDQWREGESPGDRDPDPRSGVEQPDTSQPGMIPPAPRTPSSGSSTPGPSSRGPTPTARRLGIAVLALIGMGIAYQIWPGATTSALIFILILVALVVVHELGHFFTAKFFGVYVHEFGIGFPPRIWGKRLGETEYTINWLPIGGFVRLEGEENPGNPRALAAQPRWQRFIILVSGGAVNLVLPVFLFAAALMIPHQVPEGRAVVGDVLPDSPAAEAGLMEGDVILSINGRDAAHMAEASRLVRVYQGRTIDMEIRRAGEEFTLPVHSRWAPPPGEGPTGITIAPQVVNPVDGRPFTVTRSLPPWEAVPEGARQTWDTFILARNEVIGWFQGSSGPEFAGPVGIAEITGEVARSSDTAAGAIGPLLQLAALLSLNLGIINLLPLPMLDGGRIMFLLIEIVRRGKRIAPEREALVHLVGFVAFIALALVITFMDISRIAAGESVFR
jgi:regulator of sigma E protease